MPFRPSRPRFKNHVCLNCILQNKQADAPVAEIHLVMGLALEGGSKKLRHVPFALWNSFDVSVVPLSSSTLYFLLS